MTAAEANLMRSIIHFGCAECGGELAVPASARDDVGCPACGNVPRLGRTSAVRSGRCVDVCAVCGHADMYVQKDFNRSLGLVIVTAGVLGSLGFFALGQPFFAVGTLVLMALLDGLIYLLVGDVTVCYSCHAIYRGFGPNPEHEGFNLELLERYGGRTPRR
jgi:hypothetical protein